MYEKMEGKPANKRHRINNIPFIYKLKRSEGSLGGAKVKWQKGKDKTQNFERKY